MPTTIYDSSLVTQRKRDKTISNSFVTRTQQQNTVGFPPLLGTSEQSSINNVKMGNMTFFTKNSDGKVIVNGGCPCNTPVIQNIIRGWATNITTTGSSNFGYGLSTDIFGNIYVSGEFNGSNPIIVNSWETTNGGTIYTSIFGTLNKPTGGNGTFLVKYNSVGKALWATSIGGDNYTFGSKTAIDNLGNVYIIGNSRSSFIIINNFNSVTSGNINVSLYGTLTNSGNSDAFIIKYNSNGTALWASLIGGTTDDFGIYPAVDSSNNRYVVGSYRSSSLIVRQFDSYTPGNINLSTFGTLANSGEGNLSDTYLVKYNSNGTVLRATRIGGTTDNDWARGLDIDSLGNVYVCLESYSTSVDFNDFNNVTPVGGTINVTLWGTLANPVITDSNIILAKYNSDCDTIWATRFGGNGIDVTNGSITIDNNDNIYVTTKSNSSLLTINNFVDRTGTTINVVQYATIANSGGFDSFIIKYNTSGSASWATSIGGLGDDYQNEITSDPFGNIYITGTFTSSQLVVNNYDTITLGVISVTQFGTLANTNSTGSFDGFLVKYNSSGTALWATNIGGSSNEFPNSVATDSVGNVYVTGGSNSSLLQVNYFDSITSGIINVLPYGTLANTSGDSCLFLIKYAPDGAINSI